MESIEDNKLLLLIDISEEQFRIEAEKQQLKFKLINKNLLVKFENKKEIIDSIEPFYYRHYQQLIFEMINNVLDIKMLQEQKLIEDVFFTHQ